MKEIFKTIPDFPNYQVSNKGRVKSIGRWVDGGSTPYWRDERILNPSLTTSGYHRVTLLNGKRRSTATVQHWVAIVFLGHKPDGFNGLIIDHIDHDPLNNNADNLQLITNRENSSKDKYRLKKSSKYVGVSWEKSRGKWNASIQVNYKHKNLGRFDSEIEAHEAYQDYLKTLNET